LIADIYRAGYRSSKCLLAHADKVTLVNVEGPFEPSDGRPAALLVDGPRGSKNIKPATRDAKGGWVIAPGRFAAGGSYVATTDTRFGEAVGFYGAVSLHDYDMNLEVNW
jgi:hypothetical protein